MNEIHKVEILSVKSLEDSISINLRKRDYERVSELCYALLTDFVDSLSDISVLSKLYLAEIKLDENGNRISDLKSFFENLILYNPEKESLIKTSFYLIQKCKVSLGLYESAMGGFQEIVNQNPYNYEGLIASWDYAATSLLENSGGSGGYKSHGFDEDSFTDDPTDKYDKNKFTNDNRKNIRKNIQTSFRSGFVRETERVKDLEKKIIDGKANRKEINELKTKNILKEVIKVKNPNSSFQHVSDVNSDINKVFGSVINKNEKDKIELLIPEEYSLSQNYPNPFNPVTRIKFSLPKESSVKLTVYDILGREVKKLVNEKLSVGRYEYEFNGSSFASGVYFYTLETDRFVKTKRMVLIK
ncbi:MAG: hypothetical protein HGGPFJEG_02391 [Ignavibacteria bacterium]|nr:hypothetical protein [Ignavibacteria bacterium]